MNHLRRGTLLLLIVTVLAAALIWYYFTNVYEGSPSVRGTLVENATDMTANVFCDCEKDAL